MRKIEKDVYNAVMNWTKFRRTGTGATEVRVNKGMKNTSGDSTAQVMVFVHDHLIWWMTVNETRKTMRVNADWCGFATQTTVSRMKAAFAATHLNVTVNIHHGEIEFHEKGKPVQKNCYDSEWICSVYR